MTESVPWKFRSRAYILNPLPKMRNHFTGVEKTADKVPVIANVKILLKSRNMMLALYVKY